MIRIFKNLKSRREKKQAEMPEKLSLKSVTVNGKKAIQPDKYGIYLLEVTPSTKFVFHRRVPFKRVILANSSEFSGLHMLTVAGAWRGLGAFEVELWISFLLIHPILLSLQKGENKADITELFSTEMKFRGKTYSPEMIREHIWPSFELISETEDEILVKL